MPLIFLSNPVVHALHPGFAGTMSAAVENTIGLNAMAYNLALAMAAGRGHHVNGTLKGIEHMFFAAPRYGNRFIVLVAANFALFHEGASRVLCRNLRQLRCHDCDPTYATGNPHGKG
jgi:hypothetical protein